MKLKRFFLKNGVGNTPFGIHTNFARTQSLVSTQTVRTRASVNVYSPFLSSQALIRQSSLFAYFGHFQKFRRQFTSKPNETDNSEGPTDSKPSDSTPSATGIPVASEEDRLELDETDARIDRRVYPIALSSLLMGSTIGIVIPMMPQFTMELGMNTLQVSLSYWPK